MRAAMAGHAAAARAVIEQLVDLARPYWNGEAWWSVLRDAPRWLCFFAPGEQMQLPDLTGASDCIVAFVRQLESFDLLAGVLGVLPRGFSRFIFPDPSMKGIQSPELRSVRRQVSLARCVGSFFLISDRCGCPSRFLSAAAAMWASHC